MVPTCPSPVIALGGSLCHDRTGRGRCRPASNQSSTLLVTKTGPTSKNMGEVAEFNISITNNGTVSVHELKVNDNYDRSLSPVRATDGYQFVGDDLVWRIDILPPPGKTVKLQINCQCVQAAQQACNRVTVVTQEGTRGDGNACLTITKGRRRASKRRSATCDPVEMGKEVTYEVRMNNAGQVADHQVAVSVILPAEMSPVGIGTRSGRGRTGNIVRHRRTGIPLPHRAAD